MAKFGHVFISGIAWIAIAVGVGSVGSWMTQWDGWWRVAGWLIAVIGWGFAVLSGVQLWSITRWQLKGMRLARDDPEAFARMMRRYDEATHRTQDQS
jgi:hypothetical protein